MSARPKEIDVGVLSASESTLLESESDRLLRVRLEDEAYEAEAMRVWYATKLRAFKIEAPWEMVEDYAQWTARLALVREKQERFGWPK